MFFDTTVQCFTMDAIGIPDAHHVILQFQAGIVVPGPPPEHPGEPQQQGLIPVGAIKVPTGYYLAKEFAEEILAALENMEPPPPPSKLIVAEGAGADQAANAMGAQITEAERAIRKGGGKKK